MSRKSTSYETRDRRWFAAVSSIEAEIARVTAPLLAQLEALEDQRCDDCGKFEDDDSDTHSADCRRSRLVA